MGRFVQHHVPVFQQHKTGSSAVALRRAMRGRSHLQRLLLNCSPLRYTIRRSRVRQQTTCTGLLGSIARITRYARSYQHPDVRASSAISDATQARRLLVQKSLPQRSINCQSLPTSRSRTAPRQQTPRSRASFRSSLQPLQSRLPNSASPTTTKAWATTSLSGTAH